MNKNKKLPIKYKLLIPLLTYLIIFFIVIFTFFNLASSYLIRETIDLNSLSSNFRFFKYTLFVILIIGSLIFVVLIFKISESITAPIENLAQTAKKLVESSYKLDDYISFSYEELESVNINMHKLANRLYDYHTSQKTAIANASHELRTPLMSIQGYAEGIKCNVFDDISEPLDIIIEESKRLSSLVKSLLTLSKLDSQNLTINYERVNLYSLLNNFANKLRGIAYKCDKSILLRGDKDLFIDTDETLLSQAVLNIISNAIRYAQKNVFIDFFKDTNTITILISDDGEGLSEDDVNNLFTRFYKGKKGNFGLGLSIAQSSIKYLGGDISAYDSEDGATFKISLSSYGH